MHEIEIDDARRIVIVRHHGFYTIDGVSAFYADLRQAVATAFGPQPDYAVLNDNRNCATQTQPVIAAFAAGIATVPPARRIAILEATPLARMQMRRVLERDYLRNFADEAPAIAWLAADDPATAAA